MNFREAFKSLRAGLGWSQSRLARELRRNTKTVAHWEMGRYPPGRDICEKLAGISDGELSDFFMKKAGISSRDQVAHAQFVANRRIRVLGELAAAGSDYALQELKRFADEMTQSAGHAARLRPESEPRPEETGVLYKQSNEQQPRRLQDQEWHILLEKVLRSGERTAIEAVKYNLEVFGRYVDLGQPPAESATRAEDHPLPRARATRKSR